MKIRRRHKQSGASSGENTIDTRRQFLRISGAGAVGLALESCVAPYGGGPGTKVEDGDNDGLEIVNIDPPGSVFFTPDFTGPPAPNGGDLNDGDELYVHPDNESFDLDFEQEPGNGDPPAVDYDNTQDGDYIEVDLSVLDDFEECYDPNAADSDYAVTDGNDSIGING